IGERVGPRGSRQQPADRVPLRKVLRTDPAAPSDEFFMEIRRRRASEAGRPDPQQHQGEPKQIGLGLLARSLWTRDSQILQPGTPLTLGLSCRRHEHTMAILVVEDDLDLLDILCFALRREGHDVITARDAEGALEIWKSNTSQNEPQLVLIDADLSNVGGWGL